MVAVPLVPVDAAFHADLPELYRVFNHLTVLVEFDLGIDVHALEYCVRLITEAVVGDIKEPAPAAPAQPAGGMY